MSNMSVICKVRSRYPFNSDNPSLLSFGQDNVIDVVSMLDSDWWYGWCNGKCGWFPSNHVEIIKGTGADVSVSILEQERSGPHLEDARFGFQLHPKDQESLSAIHQSRSHLSTHDTDNGYRPSLRNSDTGCLEDWSSVRSNSIDYFSRHEKRQNSQPNSYWTMQVTEDGFDHYYYNSITGEMRFSNPYNDSDPETDASLMYSGKRSAPVDDDEEDEYQSYLDFLDSRLWDTEDHFINPYEADTLSTPWLREESYHRRSLNQYPVTQNSMDDLKPTHPSTEPQTRERDSQHPLPVKIPTVPALPRSFPRHVSVRKASVTNSSDPLTWDKLTAHIALSIYRLNTAAKNSQKLLFVPYSADIVNAVRYMLVSSGTIDKDSPHIKTNPTLRAQHRAMMASVSKLVVSSQLSAENQGENVTRMLSDSNELLLATRNFVSTCQDTYVPVADMCPKFLEQDSRDRAEPGNLYDLQGSLLENLESCGISMRSSVEAILNGMKRNMNQRSRSSLAALLFNQFRILANQTSQFVDTIRYLQYHSTATSSFTAQLDTDRQRLMDSLGQLFFRMQVMTNDNVALESIIADVVTGAKQLDGVILNICSYGNLVADDVSSKYSLQGSSVELQTQASSKDDHLDVEQEGGNQDKENASIPATDHLSIDDIDNFDTDSLTDSDQITNTSSLESASVSPQPSQDTLSATHTRSHDTSFSPSSDSQSTYDSPSKLTSRKLKKFFGDDAPAAVAAASANKPATPETAWYLQYDYKPNEIVFNMEGNVKGGTLPALVERLTLHDALDMNFINTFLLTYRSFCTSMQLLHFLEARYNLTPPEGLSDKEMDVWEHKKLKLVRLRVFNVLKNWLELYYNEDDHVILDPLSEFINTNVRNTLNFSVDQLERLIRMRKEDQGQGGLKRMIPTQAEPPEPILPRNRKRIKLLDIDPLEMARQLTIIDFKLYSSILPVECLDKAWSRDPSDENGEVAVHIRASIEYCNQVTSWVSDVILSQSDIKKRSNFIKYWVHVAEKCRLLNNFNTCMAILSAFDNSSVGRLKRTWEMVGARTTQTLAQIRKLMGANRNFIEYRAIIHSINPPCIPFLGIYLQDLTFIEDGNPNYLKNSTELINFAKRAKTAEVIREIQQYQSSSYCLKPVAELQNFIHTNLQSSRDEDQLYNESLKLEPREREDEKITRLLQESGFL